MQKQKVTKSVQPVKCTAEQKGHAVFKSKLNWRGEGKKKKLSDKDHHRIIVSKTPGEAL